MRRRRNTPWNLRVTGLVPMGEENFQQAATHRQAEIFLSMDYPRRPPFCRMISPTFHPNIDPQKICIGDHWNAGQSLPQLIVRIGGNDHLSELQHEEPAQRQGRLPRGPNRMSKPIAAGAASISPPAW